MSHGNYLYFILNPKSGKQSKISVPDLIAQHFPNGGYEIVFTEYAGHATELARNAARSGFRVVVAVGGDGTVNEVARGLLGTNSALGILPKGSGNGLARHLNIPLRLPLALRLLQNSTFTKIDTGSINDHPFFCTAGLGFDGYISSVFAKNTKRGLRSYIELVAKEFFKFKPGNAIVKMNGKEWNTPCFVLTFANASQYGNNAYIAPMADIRDGLLDVCLIKDLSLRKAVAVSYGLLTKKIATSGHAEYTKATEIKVQTDSEFPYHADGEYVGQSREFIITINPLSLEVVVPA